MDLKPDTESQRKDLFLVGMHGFQGKKENVKDFRKLTRDWHWWERLLLRLPRRDDND
jgi:hypothetical protein